MRSASLTHARRQSSSFRRPSISVADIRGQNKSPLSPESLPDVYRKQAETISQLTEQVEKLQGDVEKLQGKEKRLVAVEAEKEEALEQLASVRDELRRVTGRVGDAEQGKKTSEEEMDKMVNSQVSILMDGLD